MAVYVLTKHDKEPCITSSIGALRCSISLPDAQINALYEMLWDAFECSNREHSHNFTLSRHPEIELGNRDLQYDTKGRPASGSAAAAVFSKAKR